jgi:hypothetical protein
MLVVGSMVEAVIGDIRVRSEPGTSADVLAALPEGRWGSWISARSMVREVAERDPGHGTAMRQAYIVTYRSLSPWVHSEASSFKSTTEPISKTHHRFVGVQANWVGDWR